jgi:two-component system sensor histidine kinase CpxA
MRSTFTRIFLSFCLAQSLILICTLFSSIREFDEAAIAYTSSFGAMHTIARQALDAYDAGGCAALKAVPDRIYLEKPGPYDQPAILLDPDDRPLCQQIDATTFAPEIQQIRTTGFMLGERQGPGFLVGLLVKNARGQNYVYLVHGTFPTHIPIPFRNIIPRTLISLSVTVLVTFGIALVITRPIRSLREAVRRLAAGNLGARAPTVPQMEKCKSSDELGGLLFDFNVMADRLESLVGSHKLLLRDVSHELRSPLARLSVALEWAREEAQPGIEDQLDRMESEVVRLNALIGQLLDLSHLESTSSLPTLLRFSVARIVQQLLPDMEYEASGKQRRVTFHAADTTDSEVAGSPELLGRAIENIVRNAIAYTAEGTPVEVSLSRQSAGGSSQVILQVRDHGPGVPQGSLKSIFRPFYRLDGSRQRSTGGFGVGLAIAERAVHLHGGVITARNAAEGGLIIEIALPAVRAEALQSDATA